MGFKESLSGSRPPRPPTGDIHRGAALLLHRPQEFGPVDAAAELPVPELVDGVLEHIRDLSIDILVHLHKDAPLRKPNFTGS